MTRGNTKRGLRRHPGAIDGVSGVVYIPPPYNVRYLIVGGGGGGGDGLSPTNFSQGGGGGGGILVGNLSLSHGEVLNIIVGPGGGIQQQGSNSSINDLIAAGGGKGRTDLDGGIGGSGGGGAGQYPNISRLGGAGVPGQGNAGGNGYAVQVIPGGPELWNGGGGGGAGGPGQNGSTSSPTGGNGGIGIQSDITGTLLYYAGGGGGGTIANSGGVAGQGGSGGGGRGSIYNGGIVSGTNGAANTGGGGGCDCSGGSGVVILRILTADFTGLVTGSPVITTDGLYKVIKFIANGSYTG